VLPGIPKRLGDFKGETPKNLRRFPIGSPLPIFPPLVTHYGYPAAFRARQQRFGFQTIISLAFINRAVSTSATDIVLGHGRSGTQPRSTSAITHEGREGAVHVREETPGAHDLVIRDDAGRSSPGSIPLHHSRYSPHLPRAHCLRG